MRGLPAAISTSSNGTPLKPPLSEAKQAEEEDLEEDFDASDPVVYREDPGPPVGAPGKRKGKRTSSPRLPGRNPYCPSRRIHAEQQEFLRVPHPVQQAGGFELVGIIVGYDDHARPHGRDVRPLIAARNARRQPFQGCLPTMISLVFSTKVTDAKTLALLEF